MQPPETAEFLQFEGLKQPKIYAKNMKNAKNNNSSLYCNFSPRILKRYFQQGVHAPPLRIAYDYISAIIRLSLFVTLRSVKGLVKRRSVYSS